MCKVKYRWVANSVAGFVQQLAVAYVSNGYYFYVAGLIPDGKDPSTTDAKILTQYDVDVSKWVRSRRKLQGLANIHYIRFERLFVIIANHGEHRFFEEEGRNLRDVRTHPIRFRGYSIGCRQGRDRERWHASVRISREAFATLKTRFQRLALERSVDELAQELQRLPFEPYAPVRDQVGILVRQINRQRKQAGLECLANSCFRRQRRPVRPFE